MLALSLFVVAMPLPPRPSRASEAKDDELPTVDVFIPTYNEEAVPARQHHGGGQAPWTIRPTS